MTLATNGTFIEKMHAGIQHSETNRIAAGKRRKQVDYNARVELVLRHEQLQMEQPSKAKLDTTGEMAANNDAVASEYVGNEQWGYRIASMYGIAELVAAQRESNALLRENNDLLRELIRGQITLENHVPNPRPGG